jgi:hypothetical protein
MIQDYEITLEEALKGLSARAAVEVLNYARKNNNVNLDQKTILQLTYIRMISLSFDQLVELFNKSILTAYSIADFKLSDQVVKYADLLFNPTQEIEVYRKLAGILEKNQEQLGTKNILVGNQSLPPLISNWIKDYNSGTQHDALYQMKYINGSANVKTLSPEEHAILLDILKLYDKCISMVQMWDSLPVSEDQPIDSKEFRLSDYFPDMEEVEEFDVVENEEDAEPVTPAPIPKPIPKEPVIIERKHPVKIAASIDVPTPTQKIVIKPVVPKPKPQPPQPPQQHEEPFTLGQPAAVKDREKRGLVFDQPTNIDLSKIEAEAKKQEQKQQDIANKLEELKKRQNTNK